MAGEVRTDESGVDGRVCNRASRQYDATQREVTHVYIAQ
jgi:hypothetical protein